MIVAIESLDGGGKTTQVPLLAPVLRATGRQVASGSFPDYETPVGKIIRGLLLGDWSCISTGMMTSQAYSTPAERSRNAMVLQSLMMMNRLEKLDVLQAWANASHGVMVLDRYWMSGIAYGVADGLEEEFIERIQSPCPRAVHVLIDIPVEESFRRRPDRQDAYEASRDRLELARAAYLRAFERRRQPIVSGIGTVEEVHNRIVSALEVFL